MNKVSRKVHLWKKIREWGLDILVDICSGLLLTAAIYCFAIPAEFPLTGVSGVSLIFYRLFGLPVGLLTILLNIPIILGCFKILGVNFYLKSLKTILITSAIMDIVGPRCPIYQGELLLAAICAGVLFGIGYAIVFMRASSTGGFDFLMITIRHFFPHISIGKISLVMDAVVIAVGGLFLESAEAVIYGLILSWLNSTVLDKVLSGVNSGKLTMIITDYPREMVKAVDEISGRGCTILKAMGGYSGADKQVVLCASNSKEMYSIRKRAHEVDEKAFVIILDSNEVIGEGFLAPGSQSLV